MISTRSIATRLGAVATTMTVAVTTVVAFAGSAQTAPQAAPTSAAANAAAAAPAGKVVARTAQGVMRSRIVGTAGKHKVTGYFVPTGFVTEGTQVLAEGLVMGKIHRKSGKAETFSAVRSIPVMSVNDGTLGRSSAAAVRCDILNLDLGPLDLDVLGLEVHLQRVVLDVVARSGAGKLLGNLLCAVAGLLDGGPLAGLLGQLTDLLNQILAALRMGL